MEGKKLKEIIEMKKVICAVAAFAMVAGVATIASAEVKLSGDARARLIYNDNGVTDSTNHLDSRVRIKVKGTTEGGGYALGRIRLLDGKWGQGGEYSPTAKGAANIWADYAYLGFKVGSLDIAAGKMPTGFSPWYSDDERADRFRAKYTKDGLLLAFTFDKQLYDNSLSSSVGTITDIEGNLLVVSGTAVDANPSYDSINVYGVSYTQKYSDAVSAGVRVEYVEDGTSLDLDGWKGTANLAVHFGANNILIEQSYKESGLFDSQDDRFGGYVEWNATFGSITPVARIGYTANGFLADATFGWIMIGGDEPISKIGKVGFGGDTVFAGLSSKFQTSEALSFQANLVYLDRDSGSSNVYGDNPIELSGQTRYNLSKGVSLTAKAGWLSSDSDAADDAFAAYGVMAVSF